MSTTSGQVSYLKLREPTEIGLTLSGVVQLVGVKTQFEVPKTATLFPSNPAFKRDLLEAILRSFEYEKNGKRLSLNDLPAVEDVWISKSRQQLYVELEKPVLRDCASAIHEFKIVLSYFDCLSPKN